MGEMTPLKWFIYSKALGQVRESKVLEVQFSQ